MAKTKPNCFVCKVFVTDDDFCHGCKTYICSNCDVTKASGSHELEDHLEERDDEPL